MSDVEGVVGDKSHNVVELDTTVPLSARVYDYLLGGKDNYAVDRATAERAYAGYPGGLDGVRRHTRAQRSFLARSVGQLTTESGVRQFLDIGTGIPTENNTHEVAQRVAPESKIVYVDNDPIVLVHARALLTSTPEGATDYIEADLREPDEILKKAAGTLDFERPVAITLLGILHFFEDRSACEVIERLVDAVPSGSYLVVAQLASDVLPEMVDACRSMSRNLPEPVVPRTRSEVTRFFAGLELADPGVVQVHRWRPGSDDLPASMDVPVYVGVGRKE